MSAREEVAEFIAGHDDFVIATHINPDGDALGSAIALCMALEGMGKRSLLYERDGLPPAYGFLPGAGRVTDSLGPGGAGGRPLVLIDCNSPERAALEGQAFGKAAVIDHHETGSDFGDIRWIEPSSPAAGLMVYGLLKAMGRSITSEIAVNLYAAIAVDTGSFRYSNTNPAVLRAAAELIDAGAEAGRIADSLYNTWSADRFALLCRNLGGVMIRGPVAISEVTLGMFEATATGSGDTENFANFPLMIGDIRISACLREVGKGLWKASIRSKGEANVSKVAERFGGGGHKNAAGCVLKGGLKEVREALFKELLEAAGSHP